jgi:hypothetical protein
MVSGYLALSLDDLNTVLCYGSAFVCIDHNHETIIAVTSQNY